MQEKWSFLCKNVQVLQGYSCKIIDTLIRFFILGRGMPPRKSLKNRSSESEFEGHSHACYISYMTNRLL